MATPTLVTVTGTLHPQLNASRVEFWIPTLVRFGTGPDVVLPGLGPNTSVASDGTFTLPVYGTNDPNWNPTNWNYKVKVLGANLHQEFYTQVPYDAGSLDFAALLPAQSASLGTLYAAFNHGSHVKVLPVGVDVPVDTPPNTLIVRI
jgi:hypothetical protein